MVQRQREAQLQSKEQRQESRDASSLVLKLDPALMERGRYIRGDGFLSLKQRDLAKAQGASAKI